MVKKLAFFTDEHHFALANVAVRSGQMEHTIEIALDMALLDRPVGSKFLLFNLGADRVVGALAAFLTDIFPDQKDTVDKLQIEIKRIRTERNEIIHWVWGRAPDGQGARHGSLRPYREQIEKTKTASEIQQIADDMLAVTAALGTWVDVLLAHFAKASQSKPEPQV